MKTYNEPRWSTVTQGKPEASLEELLDSRHADHLQYVRRRLLVFLGRAASFDATLALSENTIFEVFEDFDLAPRIQLKIWKLNEKFFNFFAR